MVKKLFLFVLFFICVIKVYSEDIAIIIDEDIKVSAIVLSAFKGEIQGTVKEYFVITGDTKEGDVIASRVKSGGAKLVYTIGPKSGQLAKDNLSNVSIVASLVVNPARYGLKGRNICAVSLDVSPRQQLQYLKKIAPNVRRVGVIYNPELSEEIISAAKEAAQELGLSIVSVKASSRPEIPEAIRGLEGKIDAFWVITDPTVANSVVLQRLLLFTLSNRVVLMCPAKAFVKAGCLFGLDIDYSDIGSQSAEIANNILSGTATPQDIGIQSPRKTNLIINAKIAEKINLNLSSEIKNEAQEIITSMD